MSWPIIDMPSRPHRTFNHERDCKNGIGTQLPRLGWIRGWSVFIYTTFNDIVWEYVKLFVSAARTFLPFSAVLNVWRRCRCGLNTWSMFKPEEWHVTQRLSSAARSSVNSTSWSSRNMRMLRAYSYTFIFSGYKTSSNDVNLKHEKWIEQEWFSCHNWCKI